MATPPLAQARKTRRSSASFAVSIDVPPGLSFRHIQLSARDPGFVRSVRLLEIEDNASTVHSSTGKLHVLSEGMIFRISDGPVPTSGGKRPIKGKDRPHRRRTRHGRKPDDPSRRQARQRHPGSGNHGRRQPGTHRSNRHGIGHRFAADFPSGPSASRESDSAQKYALYFGSETATKRDYDLQSWSFAVSTGEFLPAQLGGKEPNYASKGRSRSPGSDGGQPDRHVSYRLMRTVAMRDGVELYSIQLSPVDIAYLRPDFGDLRGRSRRTASAICADSKCDRNPHRAGVRQRTGRRRQNEPISLVFAPWQPAFAGADRRARTVGWQLFYRRTVRIREVRSEATPYASQLLGAETILRLPSEDDAGFHRLPLPGQPVRELLSKLTTATTHRSTSHRCLASCRCCG